jgi:hypothetical protein
MWPVSAFVRWMPSAISSSRPIVMNSVVPIANPPRASATKANDTCRVRGRVVVSRAVTSPFKCLGAANLPSSACGLGHTGASRRTG